MGMNIGGFRGFRNFRIPEKNLETGINGLPKPDNGEGPKPGGMNPLPQTPEPTDGDKAMLDKLINQDPLGEDLNRLANRNNWTW